jgi:O-antigen/teichoic acid export membrane protein
LLRDRLARNQWLLADQVLVSGMNFLTTAMLARMMGIHNFGVFSVFYIVLQYLNTIPTAINIYPMMSLAPQLLNQAEHRAFLRGMAGYQRLISLACCAGMLLFSTLEQLRLVHWRMESSTVLPFILTIFCFQAQDWFRRFCYVQNRGSTVFFNDVLSYAGQVVVFVSLWWLGRMNVNAAYYAIAVTSLAAYAVGFFKEDIGSNWGEIRSSFARSWPIGRSLLVVGQSQWLGSQGIFLIVAAVVGVNSAGGIRAALTLMGPVNILYQLLDNLIPVRGAHVYATSGEFGLVAYLRRAGAFFAVLVGAPILVAAVFARPILTLVFGQAYSGFAALLVWAGINMWLALIYRGLVYYHLVLKKTSVLARSSMVVAVVSVAACGLLTRPYGAVGAIEALVVGQLMNIAILTTSAMSTHRHATAAA